MRVYRSAFTMIELIFVMVIIGVLAAVSIPKLALTRQDAKASTLATQLSNCIEMASKGYYMQNVFDVNDSRCKEVVQIQHCYTLDADDENGTLKVTNVSNTSNECKNAQLLTEKNNLSSVSGVVHHF